MFFDINIAILDLEFPNLQEELEEIGEANMYRVEAPRKRYTYPEKRKEYYQKNKAECKRRSKEYRERTNYEPSIQQRILYKRNAYLRRKEKRMKAFEEKVKEEENRKALEEKVKEEEKKEYI